MPTQQQHQAIVTHPVRSNEEVAQAAMVQGGGFVTAIFTIVGGLMYLRRRFSRDKLELKRDKGEGHLLDVIIAERNALAADAREAWAKRAGDAELIGNLSATVKSLQELNHKTNNEVQILRLLNEKTNRELESLRDEFRQVKNQMKSCATCPLRRMNEAEASH